MYICNYSIRSPLYAVDFTCHNSKTRDLYSKFSNHRYWVWGLLTFPRCLWICGLINRLYSAQCCSHYTKSNRSSFSQINALAFQKKLKTFENLNCKLIGIIFKNVIPSRLTNHSWHGPVHRPPEWKWRELCYISWHWLTVWESLYLSNTFPICKIVTPKAL